MIQANPRAGLARRVLIVDEHPIVRLGLRRVIEGERDLTVCGEAENVSDTRTAIAELRSGDVLLIAGKGHESGQIFGDRVVPFSDHEEVAAALKEQAA